MFLCKVFIFFQIITFLESTFEEAGWTANSSKKPSKDSLKSSLNHCLGVVLGGLGASWEGLGASWGVLGRPGGFLGTSWGHLGGVLGRLGVVLGSSGASWARLGGILGRLEAS